MGAWNLINWGRYFIPEWCLERNSYPKWKSERHPSKYMILNIKQAQKGGRETSASFTRTVYLASSCTANLKWHETNIKGNLKKKYYLSQMEGKTNDPTGT